MEVSGVAQPEELRGCSEDEIAALEHKYGVRLPAVYREYLAVMGHASGRLFTHDHMAVHYRHVLDLTEARRSAEGVMLSADSLIISDRLGEQFEFIRCAGGIDTPVWYFNLWDREVLQSHASVMDWLECWRAEAETAIAGGYFDKHANGTTP